MSYSQYWVLICSIRKVSDGWIRDWGSIPVYTKNWSVSWSDDKKLLSGIDAIGWSSIKKKMSYSQLKIDFLKIK